jgi:hypothetical protein
MMQVTKAICVAAVVTTMFAGCATVQDPGKSGFLSDYSRLEEIAENHLVYDSGNIGDFSSFIIEPVAMVYSQPEDKRVFDDEELEDLQTHFKDAVREALTKDNGYQVVETPGAGTARLHIGITDVDDTIGALNISIYTKITGAGLGGAAIEGEIVDSVTGEQIAAVIRWGSGSRILRAGFTHTGDAKILINRWANDLRDRMDEAHGR